MNRREIPNPKKVVFDRGRVTEIEQQATGNQQQETSNKKLLSAALRLATGDLPHKKSQAPNRSFRSVRLVILIMGMINTVAFGQSAQEIVKHVEEKYRSIQTFSAEFTETFTWKLAKESRTTKGRFFIKKPDKFRLASEKQTISSDGKIVWRYAPQDSQVFVTDAESDPDFPLLKNLLFDYVENYSHILLGEEKLGDTSTYRLKLIPKKEDAYISEMQVWIDKKEWLTRKVIYTDIHDNATTYLLANIQINKKIDDKTFIFTIPQDVEVIDTR
jgi:outer membrane lipoprotein carrier protein